MEDFRISVKSFIVNNKGEVLIIKRNKDDVNHPGIWEIPGGRLDLGEDPFEGLKRETKEETNIDVQVLNPLKVHHFTRQDKQKITAITFLCRPLNNSVKLSKEHSDYLWIDMDNVFKKLHPAYHDEVKAFKEFFMKSFI